MSNKLLSLPAIFISLLLLLAGCKNPSGGDAIPEAPFPCENGMSDGTYECHNVDMFAQLSVDQLYGQAVNDIWGWTDPSTGKDYALVGMTDRVTFVDISDPVNPVVVGYLEEAEGVQNKALHDDQDESRKSSSWRDLKTYKNHAFIVSDGQSHGMQVFDLTRLRNVNDRPKAFDHDFQYTGFTAAHNIAINRQSGYAYAVGSDQAGGGLYIMDIQNPLSPQFAGEHADTTIGYNKTGYVHDTQCVNYSGPDADYTNDEICFNSSENYFAIANVTDKANAHTISKSKYDPGYYAHQGWLTEDQHYFLLNDELESWMSGVSPNIKTFIWDVSDLDNPSLVGYHESERTTIDHNLYIKGNYVYQANYTSGLAVLNLNDVADGKLNEVGFFDTYASNNDDTFDGAWSNYPFFDSGIVIVSDMSNGLFILRPNIN